MVPPAISGVTPFGLNALVRAMPECFCGRNERTFARREPCPSSSARVSHKVLSADRKHTRSDRRERTPLPASTAAIIHPRCRAPNDRGLVLLDAKTASME